MAKKILSETSKPQPLRVLVVEDSENDALLTILALKKGGYDPVYERVEDAGAMRKALLEKSWDVILCDYQMPQFNGPAAIAILKETGIDIPLIIVSGAIGEETAVECMRLGACDYIMKSNLPRLASAIERELKEAESRLQRKQAENALRESEERYKSLFKNNHAVMLLIDPDNAAIVDANPAACIFYGWSREELMKRKIDEINTLRSKEVTAEIELALSEKRNHFFFKHFRADGTIRDVEVYSGPIILKGKTLLYPIVHDISERRRAEEMLLETRNYLDRLINYANAPIITWDTGFRITLFNQAFERLTGRKLEGSC